MFKKQSYIRWFARITVALTLLTMILPCAAYSNQVGDILYRATTISTKRQSCPVAGTTRQHTLGTSTDITITSTTTVACNAERITIDFQNRSDAYQSLGVKEYAAYTLEAGISYCIPANHPSASYRVSVSFSGKQTRFEKWNTKKSIVIAKQVSDFLPDINCNIYYYLESIT